MTEKFVIRQLVKTIQRTWTEPVFESQYERVARGTYDEFVRENPGEYFELVKILQDEECLKFTGTEQP